MDKNLINHLKKVQEKGERQNKQKTKAYKAMCSANRYCKVAEAHFDQLEELKTGEKYETGVAVKVAKSLLTNGPTRNPKGTLLAEQKCMYCKERYCNNKGHKDSGVVDCYMYGKPKDLRDKLVKELKQEANAIEMDSNANEGKLA